MRVGVSWKLVQICTFQRKKQLFVHAPHVVFQFDTFLCSYISEMFPAVIVVKTPY